MTFVLETNGKQSIYSAQTIIFNVYAELNCMYRLWGRGGVFNYKSNSRNMDESKRLLFIQWLGTEVEWRKIPLYINNNTNYY